MSRRFIVAGVVLIAGIAAVWWFVRDDQAPSPGQPVAQPAVNVLDFGAQPDGGGDSSQAFTQALSAASHRAAGPPGPSGEPQGIVEVPAGTYRLENVVFPSNVRMEVDAGAVIEVVEGGDGRRSLWQNGVTNVSLVGVGSSPAGKPDAAGGWDVDGVVHFRPRPRPRRHRARARGLSVLWAKDFLVQNVVIRQGSSCPSCGTSARTRTARASRCGRSPGRARTGRWCRAGGRSRRLHGGRAARATGRCSSTAGSASAWTACTRRADRAAPGDGCAEGPLQHPRPADRTPHRVQRRQRGGLAVAARPDQRRRCGSTASPPSAAPTASRCATAAAAGAAGRSTGRAGWPTIRVTGGDNAQLMTPRRLAGGRLGARRCSTTPAATACR